MSVEQNKQKLWGGRFKNSASSLMERIGESISFDSRLYRQDIRGSVAHARNLQRIGILTELELEKIEKGLSTIQEEIENNQLPLQIELEDIHMHIEARLTELIGETGKKLHTGRSRNDQIAQDVRLFIKDETEEILKLLSSLLETIVQKAEKSKNAFLPGYTHLQVAQPIRFSHYLLSYFWAFYRDYQQFQYSFLVNDVLVLGSGAMAGVNYPSDREFMRCQLELSEISENSIDAVSQRDNILNFIFACSQLMIHFSRLCEEIIIYSSHEFSFFWLPDSLTTGSSIMPQKKNPDIAELIRGKSARVIANLQHIMTLLKGLPLAYNRDLQEDKIALFDSTDQVKISIEGITDMLRELELIDENTSNSLFYGFSTATDLADYLVSECKIPFREAHELVGRLVSLCIEKKETLESIEESDRKTISHHFVGENYEKAISLSASTNKKLSAGSTSEQSQQQQLKQAKKILAEME